jgi:hypothetical protein
LGNIRVFLEKRGMEGTVADGTRKSNALYTVYEFDFMEIDAGFLSETKNISTLSRVYMDSRSTIQPKF